MCDPEASGQKVILPPSSSCKTIFDLAFGGWSDYAEFDRKFTYKISFLAPLGGGGVDGRKW
jgi:hypothetical protein